MIVNDKICLEFAFILGRWGENSEPARAFQQKYSGDADLFASLIAVLMQFRLWEAS